VFAFGVVVVIERVDPGLQGSHRRGWRLPVQVFVQGLVEAFVLALGGGFVGLAGDPLHALSLEEFDQGAGAATPGRVQGCPVVGEEFRAWS
jgi:hypothetical protein